MSNPNQYVVFVDSGATSTKIVVATLAEALNIIQQPLAFHLMQNPEPSTPESLTDEFVRTIARLLEQRGATHEQLRGVVLGVPTKVGEGGVLPDGLPNVAGDAWVNATPAEMLSRKIGKPVEIANDGNLASIAAAYEYAAAVGKPFEEVTVDAIGVGSGLGGGQCRRGQIYFGEFFGAKESGHHPAAIHDALFDFLATEHSLLGTKRLSVAELQSILLEDDGRSIKCGCRRRGCIETYSCKNGLAKIYRRARAAGYEAHLNGELVNNVNLLMAAACHDDPLATMLLNLNAYVLGIGAGLIATQENQHAVIAYGAAFEEGHLLKHTEAPQRQKFFDRYWRIAQESYAQNVSFASTATQVEFRKSALGDALPALGAGLYAHQLFC